MYCVKCGVRLADGLHSCPLCDTPVWNPDAAVPGEKAYPDNYPESSRTGRIAGVAFITVLLAAVCLSMLILCLSKYQHIAWSGYVNLGIVLFYVIVLLPQWFERPHPLIFVPIDFAAVCAYLLYICRASGGAWFWPFAFPVVLLVCLLVTTTIALFRYVKKGRLYITGGLLLALGGASVLVELFEHLTFGTKMFSWSLYSLTAFAIVGVFLIVCGMIKPLRVYLERKFFL